MAITKNDGRQEVICAVQEIDGATIGAAGLSEAVDLPEGAIVVGGYLNVTTAFTGGIDITLAVSGGGASLTATDVDTATSSNALTVDGTVVASGGDTVDVTLAGTTPTGGTAYLIVEYVVKGRAAFSEG
jgi:hypothetical protein